MTSVNEWDILLSEMIEMQTKKLLACGSRLVPNLTFEDLLQPNDFPILEVHPEFRYEEGILAGMLSIKMAFQREAQNLNTRKTLSS